MQLELKELLHPRLLKACCELYQNGHFKYAALEAMQAVESALREKGVAPSRAFGIRLVRKTLGRSAHIMLSLELGNELQDAAVKLFEGAFSFYRNYAAHDGARIDKVVALRVMVLASELLDILGASRWSFTQLGGLNGLLGHGFFHTAKEVATCLKFLDGNSYPDVAMDGFMEDQAEAGVSDTQIEVMFDLGLVSAHDELGYLSHESTDMVIITTLALTDLGREVLEAAECSFGEKMG